jgi:hypothetical protein
MTDRYPLKADFNRGNASDRPATDVFHDATNLTVGFQ